MAGLTPSVISELRDRLPHLLILTPGSAEYEENMLRWNIAAEHSAVSRFIVALILVDLDNRAQ